MYNNFAKVYDRLMRDVDYASWAKYYMNIMHKRNPNAVRLMECACGTGSLTQFFAQKYKITACDISSEMLDIARKKLNNSAYDIEYMQCDMCNMHSKHKQNIIIATCDGVNYLLTKARVRKFLQSANRALDIGGTIIFDVSSKYKLYKLLPSQPWICFDKDISYMWQNFVVRNKLYMDLSIFEKQGDLYSRIDESQVQVCFDIVDYKQILYQSGFRQINVYGDKTYIRPRAKEHRWHIVATKLYDI